MESKKFKEKLIKKLEQYHKLKYMDTKGKKGKVLNDLKGKQIVLDYIVLSRSGATQNKPF